jgi:purine-binding chemotaxis protein CheW
VSAFGDGQRLLTFEIGRELFAMPISGVLEVTETSALACIPTVPREVAGVINYRGDALPVVRRERLLDLADADLPEPEHVLVITTGSTGTPRLGLNVDRVLGLVDGEGPSGRAGHPLVERRPLDGRIASILDPARLVARAREVIEDSLSRSD